MATKKQTRWYYVIVMTDGGPVFVTKIGEGKTAYWNENEKPKEFSKEWAEELAFGLMVNGYTAFAVTNKFELDTQPYNYKDWQIKWEKRKPEEEKVEE